MIKMTKKGFTLIELMIVVAIIGILAAIAIPNFIRYQLKSKQAEAKTVMGGIKTSQESFRGEYDNYAAFVPNPGVIAGTTKTAWDTTICPATCNRTAAGIVTCTRTECIGYRPSGQVYFNYTTALAAVGAEPNYGLKADSDLDGDGVNGCVSYCTVNTVGGACTIAAPACTTAAQVAQVDGEMTNRSPSFY